MGKIAVVISGKGGTGKTTTVAAVSSCLAALGHRTLCVDCDAGLKNLDIALGMTEFAVTDFADVLDGTIPLLDAVREHPRIADLYFLSAPALRPPEEFRADAMASFIGDVRGEFDFCLLDAPSGLGAGFKLAAACADLAIVVTTGEASCIRDAQRAAESAEELCAPELRLIVNRVRPRDYKNTGATVDNVIDAVGARLLGVVAEDRAVMLAAQSGIPLILYKRRRAAYHFLDVARRVAGEEIPFRQRHFNR